MAAPDSANRDSLWPSWTGYAAIAAALLVCGVGGAWLNSMQTGLAQPATAVAASATGPAPAAAPALPAQAALKPPSPVQTAAAAPPVAAAKPDLSQDIRHYLKPGETPSMQEVIQRLHAAGIREGLGAFNPPGTRPPLIGLAVPEDFALPDGFVRHHQATDDGQRIEAILMFAPDRTFYDREGRPIKVPENRVVPPQYAPPGMPLRQIVLPKPLQP
ncbi:hypothetical protein V8J88_04175 [Massilia sp. W12]|uniref:hypothetical protein n=1 Tax=Massilia sp. W12 TaxID=3126507 RepID=UPI0030CDD2B5